MAEEGDHDDAVRAARVRSSVAGWLRALTPAAIASSPRVMLLRLAPAASGPLALTAVAATVITAALPTIYMVASGALIQRIPSAIRHGFDSAAGRGLLLVLGVMAVTYVVQLSALPLLQLGTQALGRRVDRLVTDRVMRAVLGPPGIGHLESPAMQDDVAKASGLVAGSTPGGAISAMSGLWGMRLAGLGALVVLLRFRWWVGLLLLVTSLVERQVWRKRYDDVTAAFFDTGQVHRRSSWFRDAALLPGPAKEVRAFGLPAWLRQRQHESWSEAMLPVWGRMRTRPWLFLAMTVTPGVIYAVCVSVLARSALRGEVSPANLAVFAQAIWNVDAIGGAGDFDRTISTGVATLPVALDLERRLASPEFQLDGDRSASGMPRGQIRFEGIRFRYPGRDVDVYSELDLEIPAGRSLAIVGANGAGKTTLVKLLARLYDPDAGRITVDGIDLKDMQPASWQTRIAAIFQDFQKYDLSARDNVGFGAPHLHADDEALDRAAAKAGATSVVASLSDGWSTPLSRQLTGGTDLSGGQWQRLALARALLAVEGGAGVLVLDEPSANLDVRAEAELYDRFLEVTAGLTTIVISHRFSTVRRADRIVVVESGKVIEDGTHDELVATGVIYAAMFRLQASRYVDGISLEAVAVETDSVDGPDVGVVDG